MQIIDLDEYGVIKWRITDVCNYNCSYCIRKPLVYTKHIAQKDFDLSMEALPDVIRVATELYENTGKLVKIDLIGGEVSIFNGLKDIFEGLFACEPIARINITTNLSRDIDYYLDLIAVAKKYYKSLSITASFHPEYTDLDTFMEKAAALNKILKNKFKCETVITNVNTQVEEFIKRCEEIECFYMCEADLFDVTKKGTSVKNIKSKYRYLVITDEGEKIYYTTRNQVLKLYGEDGSVLNTENKVCTRDMDYVYIEQNIAVPCRSSKPLKDYHVNKKPRLCTFGRCTLCGHMSITDKGENQC